MIEDGIEFRNHVSYSLAIGAYGLAFRETGVQREDEPDLGDWHVAPRRQYVLFMKGRTQIEVSDGEKRLLSSGAVLLVEDTFGKGHRNRRLSCEPQLWAFVRAHVDE